MLSGPRGEKHPADAEARAVRIGRIATIVTRVTARRVLRR